MGKLRTADATYLKFVKLFWRELLRQVAPLVADNGGPVLMVQVENEYGFFNAGGDTAYVQVLPPLHLRLLFWLGRRLLWLTFATWRATLLASVGWHCAVRWSSVHSVTPGP